MFNPSCLWNLKQTPLTLLLIKSHQFHLLRHKDCHTLKNSLATLPMIYCAYWKIKSTELYSILLQVDEKCLVISFVILTHNQESVIFGSWKRQYCLQANIHLIESNWYEIKCWLKCVQVTSLHWVNKLCRKFDSVSTYYIKITVKATNRCLMSCDAQTWAKHLPFLCFEVK